MAGLYILNSVADALKAEGFDAHAEADLGAAIGGADIVTSATLSPRPLVEGRYLKPGQHVDLVGGFTPTMREAEDEAIYSTSPRPSWSGRC
ncbi:hypothetical protein [Ancylobacter pratisalsi]|uniref:hypothetical protein n=1 Tax=Ancylobacter pratisalsi TaxID=1745854 RepID=UPI001FE53968|nr:hypothetical protein [Ancylobacter pratisalsi]